MSLRRNTLLAAIVSEIMLTVYGLEVYKHQRSMRSEGANFTIGSDGTAPRRPGTRFVGVLHE